MSSALSDLPSDVSCDLEWIGHLIQASAQSVRNASFTITGNMPKRVHRIRPSTPGRQAE